MNSFLHGIRCSIHSLAPIAFPYLGPDLGIEYYCPLLILNIYSWNKYFLNVWYVLGPEISATDAAINQTDLDPYPMELTLEISDFFVQTRMLSSFTLEAGCFTQHEIATIIWWMTNLLKANSPVIIWPNDEFAEKLSFKKDFSFVSLQFFSCQYFIFQTLSTSRMFNIFCRMIKFF